jgi:pyrroline-5-carboxylate reductase
MRTSIIGLGNIGVTLAEALLSRGVIAPEELAVANRSPEGPERLASAHPGVRVFDNKEAAGWAETVFLCVRTPQALPVLREISPRMSGQHLVITNGGVRLENAASCYGGPISKLVPSIAMRSGRGVSLLCHGDSVGDGQKDRLRSTLGQICIVFTVRQDQFEVAADLTSCAPAFWAAMAEHMAQAGLRNSDLGREEAYLMVTETLLATATLLRENCVPPARVRSLVATPGGITERGLEVLDRRLPEVFDEVMERTLSGHEEAKARVRADLGHQ